MEHLSRYMEDVLDVTKRRRRPARAAKERFSGAAEEQTALDQYLREVSQHALLTAAQEIELGAACARR